MIPKHDNRTEIFRTGDEARYYGIYVSAGSCVGAGDEVCTAFIVRQIGESLGLCWKHKLPTFWRLHTESREGQ